MKNRIAYNNRYDSQSNKAYYGEELTQQADMIMHQISRNQGDPIGVSKSLNGHPVMGKKRES